MCAPHHPPPTTPEIASGTIVLKQTSLPCPMWILTAPRRAARLPCPQREAPPSTSKEEACATLAAARAVTRLYNEAARIAAKRVSISRRISVHASKRRSRARASLAAASAPGSPGNGDAGDAGSTAGPLSPEDASAMRDLLAEVDLAQAAGRAAWDIHRCLRILHVLAAAEERRVRVCCYPPCNPQRPNTPKPH